MKKFKVIFPYSTTKQIPEDIGEKLEDHAFELLKDGQHNSSGFMYLDDFDRVIHSDGRHLFHYCEQSRKADARTVRHIHAEQLRKVEESGREVTEELHEELKAVAEREAVKFASIKQQDVFILFDGPAQRVWCAGSTTKKCETALKRLRRVLGSLDTEPVILPVASLQLSRQLSRGGLRLGHTLRVNEYAKVVATDKYDENAARVIFDGISLAGDDVREVLTSLAISAIDMELTLPGKSDTLAAFVLKAPCNAGMSLSGMHFFGGASDAAEEHNHASDMLIAAKTCHQILSGLNDFLRSEVK